MKTATVRQLRHNFGSVLAWLEEGEQIEIRKRGQLVALISPPPPRKKTPLKRPDFAARLKRNFGDSVIPVDVVVEDRASRAY